MNRTRRMLRSVLVGAVLVSCMAAPRCLATRDGAALATLETAVGKDPDNLRAGTEYRQAIIQSGDYDRCLKFFEALVTEHPNSANAHLNFGFAYVDKIPVAGAITQVILANNALNEFTKSIELEPKWLAYYTRGNSYLYWPKIFGRTPLGIEDLDQAMKLQKGVTKRSYHVRTFIALGDGYWKMEDLPKAKVVWEEGLKEFPDNADLKTRLAKEGDDLKGLMDNTYDVTKRVNTSLKEMWEEP